MHKYDTLEKKRFMVNLRQRKMFQIMICVRPSPIYLLRGYVIATGLPARGEGVGGYSHTLPIRVCAAQRGRDFEAPDLERGIHFRGVF